MEYDRHIVGTEQKVKFENKRKRKRTSADLVQVALDSWRDDAFREMSSVEC